MGLSDIILFGKKEFLNLCINGNKILLWFYILSEGFLSKIDWKTLSYDMNNKFIRDYITPFCLMNLSEIT